VCSVLLPDSEAIQRYCRCARSAECVGSFPCFRWVGLVRGSYSILNTVVTSCVMIAAIEAGKRILVERPFSSCTCTCSSRHTPAVIPNEHDTTADQRVLKLSAGPVALPFLGTLPPRSPWP
jgi:L-lactate utilization protein LutB